ASHFGLGGICGLMLSLGPVALINHRHIRTFLGEENWTELAFYLAAFIACGLVYVYIFRDFGLTDDQNRKNKSSPIKDLLALWRSRSLEIVASVALFLYVASACLCQKLEVALLSNEFVPERYWSAFGLTTILIAIALQLACLYKHHGLAIN